VDQLFLGGHEGPYVRLGGWKSEATEGLTPGGDVTLRTLEVVDQIYGHNIFGFDLLALARHNGADYDALAAKSWDLKVAEYLVDPPGARGEKPGKWYSLDAMAERYGLAGKTDDIKALAKKWGGYDQIPLDDADYHAYLRGDLAATKAVKAAQDARIKELGLEDYAAREMRVAAIQNRITLNGWKVDRDLLAERVEREDTQREGAVQALAQEFGMPTHEPDRYKRKLKKDWPDQSMTVPAVMDLINAYPDVAVEKGYAEKIPGERRASPWSSAPGRQALVKAFADAGATTYPRTPGGDLALSSDALGETPWYCSKRRESIPGMLQIHGDKPGVRRIVELLNQATGATAKYAEIARYVTAEGRVHASVGKVQASGRWAYIEPSLTNMGMRGAAGEQRAVLVADDGEVLLTCDASQLDVRTVAALSQDPALIEMLQPGRDYHTDMALVYFGDASRRSEGKPISHGVNYGQGYKAIAERNGLDPAFVRDALQARGDTFHVQAEWTETVRDRAERGLLLDNGFGRPMRCNPDRAFTQAPALMGQGASRDVMCESLLRLVERDPSVTARLRGFVHDEVVLSVPEGDVAYWTEVLEDAFTWEWKGVPILCEVGTPAYRWSDCK
jgi:DNA polymerase-1